VNDDQDYGIDQFVESVPFRWDEMVDGRHRYQLRGSDDDGYTLVDRSSGGRCEITLQEREDYGSVTEFLSQVKPDEISEDRWEGPREEWKSKDDGMLHTNENRLVFYDGISGEIMLEGETQDPTDL
jgi:hypothetical protein